MGFALQEAAAFALAASGHGLFAGAAGTCTAVIAPLAVSWQERRGAGTGRGWGAAGTGRRAFVTGALAASLPKAARSRALSGIPANRGFIVSACVCSASPSRPPASLAPLCQPFIPLALGFF